ncbi:MAG: hypothetical protein ACK5UP_03975 [Bacteroidota bacterium]
MGVDFFFIARAVVPLIIKYKLKGSNWQSEFTLDIQIQFNSVVKMARTAWV